MIRNKKGNFLDVLGLLIFGTIFITIVIAIFTGQSKLNEGFNDFMNDTTEFNETFEVGQEILNDTTTKYPQFWDFLLVFVLLSFIIIMVIAAFVQNTNSIFMVVYWIMSFALVVVSIGMETFMSEFIGNAIITPYADFFPMTTWIINNFFIYAILLIVAVGVATYLKPKQTYDLFR